MAAGLQISACELMVSGSMQHKRLAAARKESLTGHDWATSSPTRWRCGFVLRQYAKRPPLSLCSALWPRPAPPVRAGHDPPRLRYGAVRCGTVRSYKVTESTAQTVPFRRKNKVPDLPIAKRCGGSTGVSRPVILSKDL